jgi:protease I
LKALIVAAPGVQDVELVYPYYRLQEAGYKVLVAADVAAGDKAFQGIGGLWLPAHRGLPTVSTPIPDVLVLPGGVKAMEKLRLDRELIAFIRSYHEDGGLIASMCSGAQLLISAGIVRGRRIAAYPAMQVDVENAGAEFVDAPAVVDGNLVTSPHYRHLGSWMAAVLKDAAVRERAWNEGATCAAAL